MRKSKLVVYSLLGIFIVVVGLINIRYAQLQMIYFAMFLFVPAAWLSVQLSRADTVRDYAWLSSLCKMMMLLGILSMVLVRQ
jgi:4-hydroxybenzoate polyprenyltransferase